ncbi:MAG TPA: alanine racemase [Geminicoccaceae bacterium]|nr:alanine racemase [Geminicoccaceae bacterium]
MAIDAAPAVLTVDLGALATNYRRLQREAAGSEVAGVVKANGYGLGAGAVAEALWQAGCRSFFIAQLEEGRALRARLPDAAIYLLNGLTAGTEDGVLASGLTPVLNHTEELARYAELARRHGRRLPAALQIDTGMCRLGFARTELERLDAGLLEPIDLVLVMSHLAVAEEPDHPLNAQQRARFEELRRRLPRARASLANSSGIFLGPAFHYELCRPGVALYGVNPVPGCANPMAPVITLEAPVLQTHDVEAPGTVGYGASYPTRPGMRIATIPVGYADGYPRSASDRASARIGRHIVPLAGRVSMDLITLDVSALPAGAVRPGTTVTLIGGPDGVDELANAAGTIGYEILTRLGSRFARRYIPAQPQETSG